MNKQIPISNAQREKAALLATAPAWLRYARPLVILHYRLRRLLAAHDRQEAPFEYAVYTTGSPDQRKTFRANLPTFRYLRTLPNGNGRVA